MLLKKEYEAVLFDLDGTIIDPFTGITNGYKYALEKYGIIENDLEKMKTFIGPPLKVTFKDVYGFEGEKNDEAIKFYREYYDLKGKYESKLYDGIEEVFKTIKKRDKKLYVATSKLTRFAQEILEHLNVAEYFDGIYGSLPMGKRDAKSEVISDVITENSLNNQNCIIVGDRKYDIEGAKITGIDSCGILYGYGTIEEFSEAEYVVKDMKELNFLMDEILK